MKPMTEEEAVKKWCPFTMSNENPNKCKGHRCMAWKVVHEAIEREHHSGARDMILKLAVESNRIMKRTGPAGSYGKLQLDEVGVCGMLEK